MEHKPQSSIWFKFGVVCLVLALGPFAFGVLTIATWGLPLALLSILICFVPLIAVHWLVWGRNMNVPASRASAESDWRDQLVEDQ